MKNRLFSGKNQAEEPKSLSADVDSPVKPQQRLLTFMLTKKVPPIPSEEERTPYPESKASFLSRIFFWWLAPVMNVGYKRTLRPEDLWYLEDELTMQSMADTFYSNLESRVEKDKIKHLLKKQKTQQKTGGESFTDEENLADFQIPAWTLVFALFLTFKVRYTNAIIFKLFSDTGFVLNPLVTRHLIRYVEDKAFGIEDGIGKGVGYALASAGIVLVSGILMNHFFYRAMLVGAQTKAVLTKVILDKSFKLDGKGRHDYPAGKITSMMGTDLARIDMAIGFQPFLVTFVVPVGICIGLLIWNIGVSALAGIGFFLVASFLIGLTTKKLLAYRRHVNKFTDSRVSYIKEVLNNLKIIKFYSWEPSYLEAISGVRTKEMGIIFNMQALRNMIIACAISLPTISSMVAFLVLYGVGRVQDPSTVFSSLSLFNALTQQVIMVPLALASGADAFIGLGRVSGYLSASEVNPAEVEANAEPAKIVEMEKSDKAIEVDNATFKWEVFDDDDDADDKEVREASQGTKVTKAALQNKIDQEAERQELEKNVGSLNDQISNSEKYSSESSRSVTKTFPGLSDVNMSVSKGEFIVVTGMIGSGKSSLLSALSGFMHRVEGSVNVNGSLLLCGFPWVQNATVRSNILFGKPFDKARYKEVVHVCALEADLDVLPAGDLTEIGERGITLSGGQKARINLARAVYANQDIILLDDILSAVDARVGKHIMEKCLHGTLAQKTRILATHQLSLIGSADRVVFLNGDGTIDMGTMAELKLRNEKFVTLMEYSTEHNDSDDELEDAKEDETFEEERLEEEKLVKLETIQQEEEGRLFEEEEKAVNGLPFSVYYNYVKLGSGIFGYFYTPITVLFIALATFCQLFTNTWLSFWTEHRFPGHSDGFYIGIYVMFTMLSIVFVTVEFGMLVYLTNTSSTKLNVMAIKKLLHTPMSFMDTTPMGRVLNRFTKDTDVLDNEIGEQLRLFVFPLSNIVGVMVLCIIYLPWFAIAVPVIVAMFIGIANYYQASSREVKRLEAVQRSSVYNNFNETLGGMMTIKAYNASSRFMKKNDVFIDKMNEAYYITIANQRWLSIHLDIVAAAFSLIVALLCVTRQFNISAASVGLLLSYVLMIAGQLSLLIRAMTQVENEMNSVERLSHYAFELPQEAPYEIEDAKPRTTWPEKGEIEFSNVSLAYRPGLPLVLKNLSLSVRAGEKVGICGRTGAGKSSIMTALYRLSELSEGVITIDGVDISHLGLQDLRSKLSIIPQDPVLFKGKIRQNLDPFGESSDLELWDAMRRAGLIEENQLATVKKQTKVDGDLHKFHLDQNVEDDGANFSLGEKQLIALARALVRDSKILILDEATSSVDYETDSKIQATIGKEFSQCTIMCIAHRLKTILNYDKILVLDQGEVREFDTPWNLYNLHDGIFKQMCQRSNIVAEDFK